jgi:hypothetical protein
MQGGNRSPIQESISGPGKGPKELIKSLELYIRRTPTLDNPQSAMSYAIAGASIAVSPGRTGLFLKTGSIGGTPNWPASSRGHQIAQGITSSQTGNTSFGQGAPGQHTIGPFERPEPISRNISGAAQLAQP